MWGNEKGLVCISDEIESGKCFFLNRTGTGDLQVFLVFVLIYKKILISFHFICLDFSFSFYTIRSVQVVDMRGRCTVLNQFPYLSGA